MHGSSTITRTMEMKEKSGEVRSVYPEPCASKAQGCRVCAHLQTCLATNS
jgi:hypothetical protein